MLRVDYEKQGRFKSPTRQEVLQELIEKIISILDLYKKESPDYFKSSGAVTQLIGLKKYSDKRISNLEELCFSKEFQTHPPRKQYELIKKAIEMVHPSSFNQIFVTKNKNSADFINAIISEDKDTLDRINREITPQKEDNSSMTALGNFFEFLSKPVSREKCLFMKEQAIAAANWWLDILKKEVPDIIAMLNKKKEITPIEPTLAQERTFTTALADLIWEKCQDPLLNIKGQSPLYVDYQFIKEVLHQANIIKEKPGSYGQAVG